MIWPVQTIHASGKISVISAPTVTRTTGMAINVLFHVVPSTNAPQSGVASRPTRPPTVAIIPSESDDQPCVAKNASRNGPSPSRASARKKLSAARAKSVRSDIPPLRGRPPEGRLPRGAKTPIVVMKYAPKNMR
ncbi:hypothetical protein D3C71_1699720 [compost metagenome]